MALDKNLPTRYVTIAVSASALNLLLQWLFLRTYSGPLAVEASIIIATGIVLPLKYSVEKRWIFGFIPTDALQDFKKFCHYTLVSIITVIMFWGIEYSFHLAFHTDVLRYLGGALGLMISFGFKFVLDRKFVFKTFESETR